MSRKTSRWQISRLINAFSVVIVSSAMQRSPELISGLQKNSLDKTIFPYYTYKPK